MEKEKYLKISIESLSQVFSKDGAKTTVEVMEKLRLNDVSDVDPQMMDECNSVLFQRVKMLKGDAKAAEFLKLMKAACR